MKEIENNRYCSMIEDLLPLYVEGLISEDTKKEIETHLKNCNKCSDVLKELQKTEVFDLEIEKTTQEDSNGEIKEKEIKCIKNIKRRTTLKIIISIVITCILFVVAINLWNTYRIIQDEDGKWILYNFNTGNIKQGMEYTHILMEYKAYKEYKVDLNENNVIENGESTEKQETVEHYVLLTFNKEAICVNARQIISGYEEEELQSVYEWYVNTWKNSNPNVKIQNGKLYMDENVYVGKTKEKIINSSKGYNAKITEF